MGGGLPETVPWPGRPQRQVVACGRSGHLCGLGPRRISCDCYPSAACSACGCCGPACSTSGSSRGSYSSPASCFWFASAAIKCVVLRGACFRPSEPLYRQATPFELDARGRGEGFLHFVFAAWQSRGLAASLVEEGYSRVPAEPSHVILWGGRSVNARAELKGRALGVTAKAAPLGQAGRTPPYIPPFTGKDPIADESCLFEGPRLMFSDSNSWSISKRFIKVPSGPLPTQSCVV